ncbi:MAG: GNAT family N-acetyltransferase [Candidatus Eisenbacteria bacterium]|nr:GNAT family N-acetyltransferase [Candidatus Eisenbacteria bacterium]
MRPVIELTPSLKSEVDPARWRELLDQSSGATVFHTLEWAFVLKETFRDLTIKYILVEDRQGRYVAGMPFAKSTTLVFTSYLSMPFGTYGGPVALQGTEDDVFPFISMALQGVTRGLLPFSFSCVLFGTPVTLERAVQNAFPRGRKVKASTHLINLDAGFRKLWDEAFDKETRTCARKAERSGVTVQEETSLDGAALLHSLYLRQAADWNVGTVYPQRLLSKAAELMGDKAKIWVGRLKGEPVCAVLVFYFRDMLMAWLSGQNAEGRKVRASHLVYSEILRHACSKSYSTFNFGSSGELHGVRFFKESFGGREYFYSHYVEESGLFRVARRLKKFTEGP